MLEFIEKELRKFEIKNEQALSDYLKLVDTEYDCSEYIERHHILPRSMFPEFLSEEWNIKPLPYVRHIEAHKHLYMMFENPQMAIAYKMMCKLSETDIETYIDLKCLLKGDGNPAKRPEVREKIKKSKLGVKRPDMYGKSYFGASEETANRIREISRKVHSGMTVVTDKNGNIFKTSIDDPRIKSGELVSPNKGKPSPNNAMKCEEYKRKQLDNRAAKYKMYAEFSIEQIVNLLIDYHSQGKNIFNKKMDNFSSNYSYYVSLTKHDKNVVFSLVIQRLSKGTIGEPSRVEESSSKQ